MLPEQEETTDDDAAPSEDGNEDFDAAFAEFAGGADEVPAGEEPAPQAAPEEIETDSEDGASDDPPVSDDSNVDLSATDDGNSQPADDPLAELRAQIDSLRHQQSSDRGRIAAYQRQIAALQEQSPAPAGDANEGDGDEQGDVDPELQAFQDEYPEIAGPVQKMLAAKEAEIAALKTGMAAVTDTQKQADLNSQEEYLTEQHSDWQAVAMSPKFSTWVGAQPAFIQEAAMRNGEAIVNGEEAAHLIGLYKLHNGINNETPSIEDTPKPKSGKRKHQLESAASVESKGAGAGSGPPDDFDKAFEYFAGQK